MSWGGGQERVDGSGGGWRNYGDGGGAGVQEEAARGCELTEELEGAPRPYLWAAKAVEGGESGATAGEAALSGVNGVGAARLCAGVNGELRRGDGSTVGAVRRQRRQWAAR